MPRMLAVLLLFQPVWLSVLKMWRRSMSSSETGRNLLVAECRRLGVAGGGKLRQQQVFDADLLAAAEHDRPLDDVLQFPHVARPEVLQQLLPGLGGEALDLPARSRR